MKAAQRLSLLLSVLVLLSALLLSCRESGEGAGEGSASSSVTGDAGPAGDYDADGYLRDHLPDGLNYDETVTVLGWNSEIPEFDVDGTSADEIEVSVFTRNDRVSDRLGITLDITVTLGSNGNEASFRSVLENTVLGGDWFDLVGTYTQTAAICAAAGLYRDLGDIDGSYLDFEMPWWNQSLIEETRIGDTFYLCTGDVSPSFIQMVYCIYFNADLFEDYGLESPYSLVEADEWTLERMIALGKDFYSDENRNQVVDAGDLIPTVGAYWDWPAVFHGCDIPWVVRDETGSLTVNPESYGEKGLDVMDQLTDFVQVDHALVEDSNPAGCFVSEQALMLIAHHGIATTHLRDVSFEYGCVPVPKYDSAQTQYYSTVRQPISLFGIPAAVPAGRLEMNTAVLEALASAGYRVTTPVVFGRIMQYQTSASPEMTEMLELIRRTEAFDFGRIYTREFGGYCDDTGAYLRDGKEWSQFGPSADRMKTLLEEFIRKIQTGTYT